MTGIEGVRTAVYRFPTPYPEQDGTYDWSATTVVTVEVWADGCAGLGWTYSSPAAASVVEHHLAEALTGRDPLDVTGAYDAMERAGRNVGVPGLYQQAVSAADVACWDLKARILDVALADLLGRFRDSVEVYGSGGFTNQTDEQFAEQVSWWSEHGCRAMKIKIGRDEARDRRRVQRLRELAGPQVELMVDANGAYPVGVARRMGHWLDDAGVTWFEEPVTSDDRQGLGLLRDELRLDVAAGEYVSRPYDAEDLLPVVDCLQLDATRCGGYTGFLASAALAEARHRDVSAHCGPSLHAPLVTAVPNLRHIEWFADHARLEPVLLEHAAEPMEGRLQPPPSQTGHGMTIAGTAEAYRVG